jgi:hypothetical protein
MPRDLMTANSSAEFIDDEALGECPTGTRELLQSLMGDKVRRAMKNPSFKTKCIPATLAIGQPWLSFFPDPMTFPGSGPWTNFMARCLMLVYILKYARDTPNADIPLTFIGSLLSNHFDHMSEVIAKYSTTVKLNKWKPGSITSDMFAELAVANPVAFRVEPQMMSGDTQNRKSATPPPMQGIGTCQTAKRNRGGDTKTPMLRTAMAVACRMVQRRSTPRAA